jgi:tetratricopeptide (TPR) repeat protein
MEYRSATTAARSEKNLKRAEEWGIKALESPECDPVNDARAPYFLATEVYLKQKNYTKMAEMLDIAEERNTDQLLETPFKLGDIPVTTIGEGVLAYRDQEWAKIYNQAVEYIQMAEGGSKIDEQLKEELILLFREAKEKLEIAILLHPSKGENYSTLAAIHLKNQDMDAALNTANRGLEADITNSSLYQLKADISVQRDELDLARDLYLKSIEYSDDPGPIMRKLLFVYIDMGDNEKAIDYSNELLDKYPNDANLYYNVGVLYQRLAKDIQVRSKENFNKLNEMDTPSEELINQVYAEFREVRKYAHNAKDYFYEASDLEQDENLDTKHAISEMKLAMNQMDDIFIPSIRKIAKTAGVVLD